MAKGKRFNDVEHALISALDNKGCTSEVQWKTTINTKPVKVEVSAPTVSYAAKIEDLNRAVHKLIEGVDCEDWLGTGRGSGKSYVEKFGGPRVSQSRVFRPAYVERFARREDEQVCQAELLGVDEVQMAAIAAWAARQG
jgi:hypothetical protein